MSRPYLLKDCCWPHRRSGFEPGQQKTFEPSCPVCQQLLADGKRDGTEPRPKNVPGRVKLHGPRMTDETFARRAGQREAERAARVERPDPRN